MNNFLLDFLTLGAILSGIMVITSKNPVISVLFLISVFVNVAGYLVLLGVGFIGISYLIVYVGAIAILFLFVIMMLNLQLAELNVAGSEYTQNLPLGAIITSLFLLELVNIIPYNNLINNSSGNNFNQLLLGIFNNFNYIILDTKNESVSTDIYYTFNSLSPETQFNTFHQVQSIGMIIYTNGAIWLLLAGIILLLAIVGPISLSISKKLL